MSHVTAEKRGYLIDSTGKLKTNIVALRGNTLRLLLKRNPEFAKEWHPTKNDPLTAKDATFGSNKKVWWVCNKGYELTAYFSAGYVKVVRFEDVDKNSLTEVR